MKTKKEPRQKRGAALLVGVSTLNESHFGSSLPKSISIERDVADVELMVKLGGMEVKTLLNEQATRLQFFANLSKITKTLKSEDTFVLYFSGYGGNVANITGIGSNLYSPTWCLFDSQILHSEIILSLASIQDAVDVLIISDSSTNLEPKWTYNEPSLSPRVLQNGLIDSVYLANKDFYDAKNLASLFDQNIYCNINWIKACQPNQVSYEDNINGVLTSRIKHVWNGGLYNKKTQYFFNEVTMLMPPYQSPSFEIAAGNPANLFSKRPFIV